MRYRACMASRFLPLAPGDPIGVVALSGPVESRERLAAGLEELRRWGHPLVLAPNLGARAGTFAGDDAARSEGLEWVIRQGARVVVAVRGGYGITRILPALAIDELVSAEVCFVGYSDATAILNAMAAAGARPQIHGPMVAAGLGRRENAARLLSMLKGELVGRALFRFGPARVLRPGRVTGTALGGNLSLLTSLLATPNEPDLGGAVLFLEDVGEPLYRLDRMLTHLRSSGRLRGVKALISGSLRGCGPVAERTHAWRRMVLESAPPEAVVVVDQPFGHGARNLAFPIGAVVEVDTAAGVIRWSD